MAIQDCPGYAEFDAKRTAYLQAKEEHGEHAKETKMALHALHRAHQKLMGDKAHSVP